MRLQAKDQMKITLMTQKPASMDWDGKWGDYFPIGGNGRLYTII